MCEYDVHMKKYAHISTEQGYNAGTVVTTVPISAVYQVAGEREELQNLNT